MSIVIQSAAPNQTLTTEVADNRYQKKGFSTGLATTVITNANLTGGVTSVGNATTVITNANLTGAITSIGNATSLGTFTSAQLATALTDETGTGLVVFGTSPTINNLNVNGSTSITTDSGCLNFNTSVQNKLIALYDAHPSDITRSDFYGFGVSPATLRYQTYGVGDHVFFFAGSAFDDRKLFSINHTGVITTHNINNNLVQNTLDDGSGNINSVGNFTLTRSTPRIQLNDTGSVLSSIDYARNATIKWSLYDLASDNSFNLDLVGTTSIFKVNGTTGEITFNPSINSNGTLKLGGITIAAPASTTSGYVLTANSATTATWVAPSGAFTGITNTGTFNNIGNVSLNSKLVYSTTAITIASGFTDAPTITSSKSNGTLVVYINIATGNNGSTGTLTMPTASNGWMLLGSNTDAAGTAVRWTASTTTSVSVVNYSIATGLAQNWSGNSNIILSFLPF
jgi:hypothetical protein